MRQMRILMILLNQVGRGTYWRAFHLARALVKHGHAVTIMAATAAMRGRFHSSITDGVTLIETPDLFIPLFQVWRAILPRRLPAGDLRPEQLPPAWIPDALCGWNWIDAFLRVIWTHSRPFDIVHAFESRPTVLLPALTARWRGTPLVMDWCDWLGGAVDVRPNRLGRFIMKPLETFFEDNFRRCAHGSTVINSFLQQRAVQVGVEPESILLLRNGAVLDFPLIGQTAARRQTGLPPDKPLIGYVGRIAVDDTRLMAAAFNRLCAARPQARLVLIGYFNRQLEDWLTEANAVIRTGPLSPAQMYVYLQACDLCWLPLIDDAYNRGRLPFKLTDYLAVGRAVVATRVGDLPEIIERYRCGLLTTDTAAGLANQTIALLDSPSQLDQMGRAARQAAETEFSWDNLASKLEGLYARLCA